MALSPTPWKHGTNGASAFVYDADGKVVAKIQPRKDAWNGDALAAAPTLQSALRGLLDYTGGWDLTDPEHPIVVAQNALRQSGVEL